MRQKQGKMYKNKPYSPALSPGADGSLPVPARPFSFRQISGFFRYFYIVDLSQYKLTNIYYAYLFLCHFHKLLFLTVSYIGQFLLFPQIHGMIFMHKLLCCA